jgi:hypothetical protein
MGLGHVVEVCVDAFGNAAAEEAMRWFENWDVRSFCRTITITTRAAIGSAICYFLEGLGLTGWLRWSLSGDTTRSRCAACYDHFFSFKKKAGSREKKGVAIVDLPLEHDLP